MKKLEYILDAEWLSFHQLIELLKSYKINPHIDDIDWDILHRLFN
jgi:hypothetical protein